MSSSEYHQSSEDKFSDGKDDVLQAIFDAENEDGEFEGFSSPITGKYELDMHRI